MARRARLRGRLRAGRRAGEAGGRAGRLHRSRPLSASARRPRAHQPGSAGVGDRRRAQEGPRRREPEPAREQSPLPSLLVDGIDVEYSRPDGSIAGDKAWLVDFDDPEANDWLAIDQFTVVEGKTNRRPDVVVFVNGLPLAVIELKNPGDAKATTKQAFNQLQTYKQQIPSLFTCNELLVATTASRRATARSPRLGAVHALAHRRRLGGRREGHAGAGDAHAGASSRNAASSTSCAISSSSRSTAPRSPRSWPPTISSGR